MQLEWYLLWNDNPIINKKIMSPKQPSLTKVVKIYESKYYVAQNIL